jgi:hypothetical protein
LIPNWKNFGTLARSEFRIGSVNEILKKL